MLNFMFYFLLIIFFFLNFFWFFLQVIDKETVSQLDTKVKDGLNSASELAICHAADILIIINKLETALDYVERVLNNNPNFTPALIVKGWILLNKGKKLAAADCFKAATAQVQQLLYCYFIAVLLLLNVYKM